MVRAAVAAISSGNGAEACGIALLCAVCPSTPTTLSLVHSLLSMLSTHPDERTRIAAYEGMKTMERRGVGGGVSVGDEVERGLADTSGGVRGAALALLW